MMEITTCELCGNESTYNVYCGAYVCGKCDHHNGLARCYCGWSADGLHMGREQLEEMGEVIEPESPDMFLDSMYEERFEIEDY